MPALSRKRCFARPTRNCRKPEFRGLYTVEEMTDASPIGAQDSTNPKPLAVALLAGFGLSLVPGGVVSLCAAFSSGEPLTGRLLMIAMAAVSLFLPSWFALALLRNKWTTGRWTLPREERQARRSRIATSRVLRFASSPAFSSAIYGIMVVLSALNVWLETRKGIHAFQLIIVVVWSAIAASSLWRLLHRYRATPES